MDTIQQVLQQKALTGELKKPNANNPLTRERMKLSRMITQSSAKNEIPESEVALHFVRQSEGDLKRFVAQAGEIPSNDIVHLCVQADNIRRKQVQQIADATGYEMPEAEIFLEQMEADGVAENPDADNFLGAVASAVRGVASRAVNKIVQKKEAKGKKATVWKDIAAGLDANQSVLDSPQTGGGFGVFAQDVLQGIKDAERKKEINKMIPGIIAAVVLIVVITYMFAKKAS